MGKQIKIFQMDLKNLVFVYGTLKRDEPNWPWMTDAKHGFYEFMAEGSTEASYPLVIASKYNIPFMLDLPDHKEGGQIKGEIFAVDDDKFAHLDILEDYPKLYKRRKERINLKNPTDISKFKEKGFVKDGQNYVECWMYFLVKHKPEMLEGPFYTDYRSAGDHGRPYCSYDDLSDPEDI